MPVTLRPMARLPMEIYESSGIVITAPDRIWSHEDSNNENQIFCFDTTGALLRTLTVENATNVDWEDLTRDNQGRFYINDAGNNDNDRKNLAIYRIPNPETVTGTTVRAEVITFSFPDQKLFPPPQSNRNFDIEALIWHNDSLFLFSKNRSIPQNGYCKMYKIPANPGQYVAKLADSIYLGNTNDLARVTAADLHPITGELMLLTATRLLSFKNYQGSQFLRGIMTEYVFPSRPGQNEGLAFVTYSLLYMTEEGGLNIPGNLYEIRLPASITSSDAETPFKISIYPNPANEHVSVGTDWQGRTHLMLCDIQGKTLYQADFEQFITINLHRFPSGLYFVLLTNGGRHHSQKVMKK